MRCEFGQRRGVGAALLLAALVWLNGCTLLHRKPELPLPSASEQMMIEADQAWQARNYDEARRIYGIVTESFPGDPNREEAWLRLALLQVILPGEGPDAAAALELLAGMDQQEMSVGQAAYRQSLLQLLELYQGNREAIRMLLEQNRRLEAQLAGREVEAIRQKASLYQWRLDVGQANQRVEQLEVELGKIRQEIKLLKDIDMMLQNESAEDPSPPGNVP
jgi:hypothetical protein